MNRKGDASIVATVILIISAIAIAAVVTNFSKDTEEKVGEKIVKLGEGVDCEDIRISANYDSDTFTFMLRNRGSLGIDKFVARVYEGSNVQVKGPGSFSDTAMETDCIGAGVVDGRLIPQKECSWSGFSGNPDKLELIPVLIGGEGEDITCDNRLSLWENG
jgi:hypothetical protein